MRAFSVDGDASEFAERLLKSPRPVSNESGWAELAAKAGVGIIEGVLKSIQVYIV